MAAVFMNRSYHNDPEKSNLYQIVAVAIATSHQDPKIDLSVLNDVVKDLKEFIKSL